VLWCSCVMRNGCSEQRAVCSAHGHATLLLVSFLCNVSYEADFDAPACCADRLI
jgi:hypothetical protein